jgi:hypothetical protein
MEVERTLGKQIFESLADPELLVQCIAMMVLSGLVYWHQVYKSFPPASMFLSRSSSPTSRAQITT